MQALCRFHQVSGYTSRSLLIFFHIPQSYAMYITIPKLYYTVGMELRTLLERLQAR
jgi:hypothetical protein